MNRMLYLEALESRVLLSDGAGVEPPEADPPVTVDVTLDPVFDALGFQPEIVQGFGDLVLDPDTGTMQPEYGWTYGIFDTGASPVTLSYKDQEGEDFGGGLSLPGLELPILVEGGAGAEGVGGELWGDVSVPLTFTADGLHAWEIVWEDPGTGEGFPIPSANWDTAAAVPGIQTFVGDSVGSPILPSLAGTPILAPSPTHPSGAAALVAPQGFAMDFSILIPGFVIYMPDLWFVDAGMHLAPGTDPGTGAPTTTDVLVFDTVMIGEDNIAAPGSDMSVSPSPAIAGISAADEGSTSVDRTLLLDTGAMLTVISTDMALDLNLDLSTPEFDLDVAGAAGTTTLPGYVVDHLALPARNGDMLNFYDAQVYIYDVGYGIDGLLGMNLFNQAHEFLYDPHVDPRFEITYLLDPWAGMSDLEIEMNQLFLQALYLGDGTGTSGLAFGADYLGSPLTAKPDLLATSFDAQEPLAWNQTFDLDITIANDGNAAAAASTAKVYLSQNGYISTSDVFLGDVAVGAIAAGGSVDISASVTMPGSPPAGFNPTGHYYIGVISDGGEVLDEWDETNNANEGSYRDWDRVYVFGGDPDLVGTAFDAPTAAEWGDGITVDLTVDNDGTAAAGASTASIYMSSNGYISSADYLLDTVAVGGIAAGGSLALNNVPLTLPGSAPAGFTAADDVTIGVIYDTGSVVAESDETNNANEGMALDMDRVLITPGGPDLVGTSFNSDEPLRWGDTFDIDATVKNLGPGATSTNATVHFYASVNGYISTADELLGSTTVGPLAAGASATITNYSVTLPGAAPAGFASDGLVYIGMIIDRDDAILEESETNNANRGNGLDMDPVYVRTGLPDMVGTSFTPDAGTTEAEPLAWGDSFNVSVDVTNEGINDVSAFVVRIFISVNGYISTSDYLLTSATVFDLDAGDTRTIDFALTLPGSAPAGFSDGPVFIGIVIDPAESVAELDETNNANEGDGVDMDLIWITSPAGAPLIEGTDEVFADGGV